MFDLKPAAGTHSAHKKRSMRQQQHTLRFGEGDPLFVRSYTPAARTADRTLVLVHGVGEHSGRYEHFVAKTVARDWNVVAGDLQGHGRSAGVPTHLDDFTQYLEGLDQIWSHFDLRPDRTALLGHSMGGLVAARYAQTRPDRLGALVLSSPLLGFGVRVNPLKRTFGRLCLLVAPQTRFQTTIPVEHITRNPRALLIRETDPLSNRTVTAGWYFRILDAVYDAWCSAEQLRAPILLLQGDADQVVNAAAPLGWLPTTGTEDRTLWLLRGHLHELLNEPGWERTVARIHDWLDHRVPLAQARPPARLPRAAPRRAA